MSAGTPPHPASASSPSLSTLSSSASSGASVPSRSTSSFAPTSTSPSAPPPSTSRTLHPATRSIASVPPGSSTHSTRGTTTPAREQRESARASNCSRVVVRDASSAGCRYVLGKRCFRIAGVGAGVEEVVAGGEGQ
jgi:hypothetical protein